MWSVRSILVVLGVAPCWFVFPWSFRLFVPFSLFWVLLHVGLYYRVCFVCSSFRSIFVVSCLVVYLADAVYLFVCSSNILFCFSAKARSSQDMDGIRKQVSITDGSDSDSRSVPFDFARPARSQIRCRSLRRRVRLAVSSVVVWLWVDRFIECRVRPCPLRFEETLAFFRVMPHCRPSASCGTCRV